MDPRSLSKEIEERYRRYLQTTFHFKDPVLRESFEQALRSGHLSQGPFLEETPVFKRGQSPRTLFHNLLGCEPQEGFLKAMEGDRSLYLHQEQAIQKVCTGHNVVIATGTGSGKTEAFLYPILLRLYQEFQSGTLCPGVRALILYPMNALANDQRERLGKICENLKECSSPFQFTFGQYVGATPDDEHDSKRHAHDQIASRLPGELVLRSEMRQSPPHILLTNYSMLEYLLLRPDDSPLFDNGHARWWTFLVLDEAHQYRGSRGIEMAMLMRRLKQRLREGGCTQPFRCIATSATLDGEEEDKCAVAKFASDLFGEEFQGEDVILGETVQTDDSSKRYHLFLRALEGAFVAYWPQKEVFLDRKTASDDGAAFEVALCRECGQHYFVGKISNGKLKEAIRDPGHLEFGVSFFRPIENDSEDEEEDEVPEGGEKSVYWLCTRCGSIGEGEPYCGHAAHFIRVVKEASPEDEDKADQIVRCGACGYSAAGRDPVREVVHGTDGPHAVIATTLYQSLPEKRKKVLAFADGRQEAAFFAWYLEDSYRDILTRNLLLKIARSIKPFPAAGIGLTTIANEARTRYRDYFKQQESDDELTIHKNIWRALYREFLTAEQRVSLEGTGLIYWSIQWPDWIEVPKVLLQPPWSLNEQKAWDLMYILLDSMRKDRAVELRTDGRVSLNWSDLDLQASQMRFRIGAPKSQKDIRSWDSDKGRRARFLVKLFRNYLPEQKAMEHTVETLRAIWETLGKCDESAPSSHNRLLVPVEDARRLNPAWWRLHLVKNEDMLFQCDTCSRLQAVSVRGVCPRHNCPGTLQEVRRGHLAMNHYRLLYEGELPGRMRVEEHTAQLAKNKATEFQREFREGKIHVLSCSTTFELGVDLGDLDTVFLRNVPPEAFNYAQRVGRAGRRSDFPGFAITFCRRNSHDMYHFAEHERMLSGKVRPPVLSICNEKIVTRHIVATALSAFFRACPDRFKTVADLIKNWKQPTGVSDFRTFLQQHHSALEKTLRNVVPLEMQSDVGLNDGGWINKISGAESRFALAEVELASDYQTVSELEDKMKEERKYNMAKWAQDRAETIAAEDVLSFLSRKAVIPKYGFPVDVVELDTQRTQQNQEAEAFEVSLQRDLSIAIAEFTPTSQLVANKKVWTSYGLKKVIGKEWPLRHYKRCPQHNVFHQWEPGQPEPQASCGDELTPFKYIVPQFGFVSDKPKNPTSRFERVFTTRPYFAGSQGPAPDIITIPANSPLISIKTASPGLMVVLCEGRRGKGFYVCNACGAGFRERQKQHKHKNVFGRDCCGTLEQVSLGHEFITDVLQLQFSLDPEKGIEPLWFTYSLAFALVEGAAEVLEVPSTDLNTTVAYSEQRAVHPIVLYDNVPGGAGLVARLEEEGVLRECFEIALKRVGGNCGCEENTSCYGCLRSYRNQFAHQNLQRGPVKRYLDTLLSDWK